MSVSDHFSGVSPQYAVYRPRYPAEFIADVAALAPARDLAWDCGTGTGQAAHLLTPHFAQILATDLSPQQIAQALPHPKIHFAVAREDESGLPDHSVDLITVATALHWFDLERFYPEVRRVLKPHGAIAAWCYGWASINGDVDAITHWFAEERVGRYWPPERRHVDNGYCDIPFPFAEVSLGARTMTHELTRDEYVGYVGTWSSVSNARKAEKTDPLLEFSARLRAVWESDTERRVVTWPLAVRAGHV